MSDLTPITRNEHLLNGDDLEPKNRKEMFLKRIYDKTQSVPEPETREEYFLKKAGDASGELTIEQLNVTENGTYSASGKAYSPVIVEVPVPQSYLVKDVPNLPQSIATIDDAIVAPIIKLKANIEAVQSGSGDPSPTNIRPISGWSGANVSVYGKNLAENVLVGGSIGGTGTIGTASGYSMAYGKIKKGVTYTVTTNDSQLESGFFEDEPQIGSQSYDSSRLVQSSKTFTAPIDGYIAFRIIEGYTQYQLEVGSIATTYTPYVVGTTYPISWQTQCGTVYGGNFKVFKDGGKWYCTVTATHEIVKFDGSQSDSNFSYYYSAENNVARITWAPFNDIGEVGSIDFMSDKLKPSTSYKTFPNEYEISNSGSTVARMFIGVPTTITSVTDWQTYVTSNNITVRYKLATPTTTTFEIDTEIATLLRDNNIFADCGDIEECRYVTGVL